MGGAKGAAIPARGVISRRDRSTGLRVVALRGMLAAGYVFTILAHAFKEAPDTPFTPVRPWVEGVPLGLAAASLLMGLAGAPLVHLIGVGAP